MALPAWFVDAQLDARKRVGEHRLQAWQFVIRAAIAFLISAWPHAPAWVGIAFFWLAIAFGLAAEYHFEKLGSARAEVMVGSHMILDAVAEQPLARSMKA